MSDPARLAPRRLLAAIGRRVWSRLELCIYSRTADRIRELPNPGRLHRDRWQDLAQLRAWSYPQLTREQYLDALEGRRGSGVQHLYSLVEDGVLVHYGWLISPQERAPDEAIGLAFIPPPRSAGLWDYFTHPTARGRGLYGDSLRQCMHDAVAIDGAQEVFIYVYANNAVSRRVIEKAGFEYRGSLVMERRLFFTRRYATCASGQLEVRELAGGRPAHVVCRARRAEPGTLATI